MMLVCRECWYMVVKRGAGDESRRSGKANEDREDDGEKNVWSVFKS